MTASAAIFRHSIFSVNGQFSTEVSQFSNFGREEHITGHISISLLHCVLYQCESADEYRIYDVSLQYNLFFLDRNS